MNIQILRLNLVRLIRLDSMKVYFSLSLAQFWQHATSQDIKEMPSMSLFLWHKCRLCFSIQIVIIFP